MEELYVHGYELQEAARLQDQAATPVELLHSGTAYPAGSRVLEAGCGVGAQTVTLARRSPAARITAIDISRNSVDAAHSKAVAAGVTNVEFRQADILCLPFEAATFDHVFVCFVLEHLANPLAALRALRRTLRPGGTLTVIEGDHGSAIFHPDGAPARHVIDCLVELQARAGGNALIGRMLYPLLQAAEFGSVMVQPRMVYADASCPEWVEGFTRKTFIAMVKGVERMAVESGLSDQDAFEAGLQGLERTTQADGTFGYTFFKAMACMPHMSSAPAAPPT